MTGELIDKKKTHTKTKKQTNFKTFQIHRLLLQFATHKLAALHLYHKTVALHEPLVIV